MKVDKKHTVKTGENAPVVKHVENAAVGADEYREPAIPLFLCLVCMLLALIAGIINAFVYPFGDNLLAPVILELLAIVFPCYLVMLSIYPRRSAGDQMRTVGFRRIGARYIFFLIFAALFIMCASMAVSVIFGGVYSSAEGLALLGTFVAGENDYTVSWPYLILAYALVPALAEELLLRGMVLSQLDGVGFAASAAVSAVLSALLGFSLGGFLPALLVALLLCFVFYTTGSLWACVLVRLLFNLYRLFLESNISAYYVSTSSKGLLLVVLLVILLISGALFFSEASKIYRENTEKIKLGTKESRTLSFATFKTDVKRIVSYRVTAILLIACIVIYATVVVVGYLT